jgi:hypothetical protein
LAGFTLEEATMISRGVVQLVTDRRSRLRIRRVQREALDHATGAIDVTVKKPCSVSADLSDVGAIGDLSATWLAALHNVDDRLAVIGLVGSTAGGQNASVP